MNGHVTSAYSQNWWWPIRGHLEYLFLRPTCYERDCKHVAQWREQLGCDLKSPRSKVSAAPVLQHGFDKTLCVMGTHCAHPSIQMTDSNTCKFPSPWDKVFRGPCLQGLEMNLLQCRHCFPFFTRHLFIMCGCVRSKTRLSAEGTQQKMPESLSLQKRETLPPLKLRYKPFSFFRGPAELLSRQPVYASCDSITFMWASLTLFPSSAGRSQNDV